MANKPATATFDRALERYKVALNSVENKLANSTNELIVDVLIARDELQELIENDVRAASQHITQFRALDHRLRSLGPTIAERVDLEDLRVSLNRSSDHWWWTFKPPVVISSWDRYDWVWNALTAGALALAASFMVNIYSAFAAGNATVATALSTIVQAAGLVVVGGGAFTADGQEKVAKILSSLNIPRRFYAESTFIIALLLFAAVYVTNNRLDEVFLDRGDAKYDEGSLTSAGLAYRQGLDINPEEITFHQNLGEVHESLGQLDSAFEEYLIGSEEGDPESLNDLGRVAINHSDPVLAQTYLLMGLQRAQTSEDTSPYLYYQLNRNIGWALIQQENYPEAIEYLEKAMAWRSDVEGYNKEGAMGNCFLAYAYEQEKETANATENWQKCIKHSRPDYLHEFRWLISVGKYDIAYCVNTEKVVAGYNKQRPADVDQYCNGLFAN